MRDISLRMELLDRQVVDADDLPFARVDDLELDLSRDSADGPAVTRLLCSQEALGRRLGGLSGRLLERSARRLRDTGRSGGFAVEPADVERWEPVIRLRSRLADLDAAPLEGWLGARVVRRLPGADDAGR